jgi:hypothetical protein
LAIPWGAPAGRPLLQLVIFLPDTSHWTAIGNAIVESAAGHDSCFSLRNMGAFSQQVSLPKEAQGQYAVLLALASSERIDSDGAITGLPCLYGFMLEEDRYINAYLQGQQMLGSETQPNKWGPVYGIFMVPPGTTTIQYMLNQAERQGVPQNGSAARFDDLGLYILPSELEAKLFVQFHFNQRTP